MRRLALLAAVALVLVVAFVVRSRYREPVAADPSKPAGPVSEAAMKRRAELFAELRPVTLKNCELVRLGGANDGGYLMCKNLMAGLQTAYSYGIGAEDNWGCDVSATHHVPVHQYDCFAPTALLCKGGVFQMNVECVGPRAETLDQRRFDTLSSQIARNGDAGKKMVVKMDIEGAEWQTILATPDDVLDAIDQMPMELHGVDDPDALEGLRKLKAHFHLVSVHFNNWSCKEDFAPMPAWAYQVLLVNKRIGVVGAPPAGSPTAESLLAPDNPARPECRLPAAR